MLALAEQADQTPGLPCTLHDYNGNVIMQLICFRPDARYVVTFSQCTFPNSQSTFVYDHLNDFFELMNFVERTVNEQAHLHEAHILYNDREILRYRRYESDPYPKPRVASFQEHTNVTTTTDHVTPPFLPFE